MGKGMGYYETGYAASIRVETTGNFTHRTTIIIMGKGWGIPSADLGVFHPRIADYLVVLVPRVVLRAR